MTVTEILGPGSRVELPQGTIEYWESGQGRPVVFVHGLFVNAALWRDVVPGVAAAGLRCIVPNWPFGSHERPLLPDARLDPPGIATLISDFLTALDLNDVILVANDTGGAFSQLTVVHHPERIAALVLTPSDSLECFFPPLFRYLQWLSRIPRSTYLVAQGLRIRPLHRLPMVLGLLSKRPLPAPIVTCYLQPMWQQAQVRRDLQKVIRGVDNAHTLAAAERFPRITIPVLLAWAREDKLFTWALANRLAALFPNAELRSIDDSYTFVPEDRPDRLVEMLVEFAATLGPVRERPAG